MLETGMEVDEMEDRAAGRMTEASLVARWTLQLEPRRFHVGAVWGRADSRFELAGWCNFGAPLAGTPYPVILDGVRHYVSLGWAQYQSPHHHASRSEHLPLSKISPIPSRDTLLRNITPRGMPFFKNYKTETEWGDRVRVCMLSALPKQSPPSEPPRSQSLLIQM